MTTDKRIPGLPVTFLAMPTGRAGSGGMARVHRQHQNPCAFGLVGYEGAHLAEPPTLEPTALRLASRGPVAYPCKVFAGDSRPRVFGLGNQSVANPMVLMSPHAGFPQTDFLQFPFCTFGASFLAGAPHAPIALTAGFHTSTAMVLTVIRGGEVLDAQINANHVSALVSAKSGSFPSSKAIGREC